VNAPQFHNAVYVNKPCREGVGLSISTFTAAGMCYRTRIPRNRTRLKAARRMCACKVFGPNRTKMLHVKHFGTIARAAHPSSPLALLRCPRPLPGRKPSAATAEAVRSVLQTRVDALRQRDVCWAVIVDASCMGRLTTGAKLCRGRPDRIASRSLVLGGGP
jgi:hypothetical protein